MAVSSVQSCPFPAPADLCKSLTSQIQNAAAKKAAAALPDPHDQQKWAENTGKSGADLVKHVANSAAKAANMVPVP